jgi:hypothetical protein
MIVARGGSFADLVRFAPIALLIAALGSWVTWRDEGEERSLDNHRPGVGWFIAAGGVMLLLLFGYSPFWIGATIYCLAACAIASHNAAPVTPVISSRRGDGFRLAGLCLVGIVLPLVLHQPDRDDAFYLSVATDAIRHPDQAIWSTDTIHDNPNLPVFLPIYKTEAFEHLIAMQAKLAHCSCIRADHTLLPAVLGIFVMLAWTMLARTIDAEYWFGITVTAVLIMLFSGASRSSPGNFAFTRLQQGKSVFASGIVPLLCVYSWRWMTRGGWRNALLLMAAQIAGVGVSSTAILIGPLVTMGVAIAALPQHPRDPNEGKREGAKSAKKAAKKDFLFAGFFALFAPSRLLCFQDAEPCDADPPGSSEYLRTGVGEDLRALRDLHLARLFIAGLSCIYPFSLALLMRKPMLAVTWIAKSPMHPTRDEVRKVLGDGPQLWFFLGCMLLVPLVVPRRSRRLVLGPIVLLLVVLINPLATRFLQSHVFSPLTYWRGMWVVPWLIFSAVAVRGVAGTSWIRRVVVFAIIAMLLGWHPIVSPANGTYFRIGGLSVDQDEYAVALELVRRTPPGTAALAPELVASWTATLDQRPPLIFVRPYYTQPNPTPGFDDAGMRNLLGLIAGEANVSPLYASALVDGAARYHLGAIVLRDDAGQVAANLLAQAGFKATNVNRYVLWVREPRE